MGSKRPGSQAHKSSAVDGNPALLMIIQIEAYLSFSFSPAWRMVSDPPEDHQSAERSFFF